MSTLTQPPPVHFDAVRRFTIEEYYRLVEAGILEEDARVELLDGQLIPMSPIGPRHQRIVSKLLHAFIHEERGLFVAEQGCPLPIPVHDVPEPDLVLYRPGTADEQRHVRPADVFLVVEVADSTRTRDLGYKADLYRRAEVAEYWVLDVRHRCLRVFTLTGGRYETRIVREGKVSPKALPGVEVDVSALLLGGA